MSVYRRPGQAVYSYDFRLGGHRFSGSTGETEKRRAEAAERAERQRVKARAIDRQKPLTFAAAATLWWEEAGKHRKNADDTLRTLAWLQARIGMRAGLATITDARLAELVAERRAEGVSNATVNRTVTEPLRAIMRRAVEIWGQDVRMPKWRRHILAEPRERVREMTSAEESAYFAALRPDYHPIARFALLSGCRLQELVDLEWRAIDWHGRAISITGKGGKVARIPMSDAMAALLRALPRAAARVFTYEVQRADVAPRGSRLPITREGLKTAHRRAMKKAGIDDFRWHDLRHTAATRLLRASGNLRHAQKLLRHEDIATTARYAHVTDDDLRGAMDAASATEIPTTAPPTAGNIRK